MNSALESTQFSAQENLLLNTKLPHDLNSSEQATAWNAYQAVIARLLMRMGRETMILEPMARVALVNSFDGIYTRFALVPRMGESAMRAFARHGLTEIPYCLAGECSLMELSAAAGYRTFCLPDLVRGLLKTGKMRDQSVTRMMDTFEFLKTMVQLPLDDPRVARQLERTNGLHGKYKVAAAHSIAARDLFKYIALNMFYIGPSMRTDLTPAERHAICGLTVLVAKRMGHCIDGTVKELDHFIADYEATQMFSREDSGSLRQKAIEIARASKQALYQIPTVSPERIHSFVPHRVKMILQID